MIYSVLLCTLQKSQMIIFLIWKENTIYPFKYVCVYINLLFIVLSLWTKRSAPFLPPSELNAPQATSPASTFSPSTYNPSFGHLASISTSHWNYSLQDHKWPLLVTTLHSASRTLFSWVYGAPAWLPPQLGVPDLLHTDPPPWRFSPSPVWSSIPILSIILSFSPPKSDGHVPPIKCKTDLSLLCCCQLSPSAATDRVSQRWPQLASPPQLLFWSVTSPPPPTETGSPVLSPWIRIRLNDLLAAKGMFDFRGEAGEDSAALAWLYWNIPLDRGSPSLSEHLAATPTCVERPGMCFVSSSAWFLSNRILRVRWQRISPCPYSGHAPLSPSSTRPYPGL